jgi:hypothetical protein
MSTKILSHQEQVRNVIARHEHYLAGEAAKAAQAQAAIEEQAAVEAQKLQPIKDSLAELNGRFGDLVRRHDDLVEEIRRGEIRLAQQRAFVADFDALVERVFASTDHGRTPSAHDVQHALGLNPQLLCAPLIVPRFEKHLAEAKEQLADVEQSLLELSQTARLPAA